MFNPKIIELILVIAHRYIDKKMMIGAVGLAMIDACNRFIKED